MTRILLAHGFSNLHSAERMVLSFIRMLNRDEFEPILVCSKQPAEEIVHFARKEKIRCFRARLANYSGSWDLIRFVKFMSNELMLFFQMLKIIRKYSISMIQVHSFSECLQMMPVSFITKKPLLWVVQEALPIRRFPRCVFSFLSGFVYKFLPISRYVARNIRISGIPRKKVQQVPLGISVSDSLESKAAGSEEKSIALVIQGGNRYIIESLIQAIKLIYLQFEHVKFFISPEQAVAFQRVCEQVALTAPLPKIQLNDSFGTVNNVLDKMDLLVYVGVKISFPVEIMEAMSSGIACVANHSGAVPEVLVDRKTGILVSPQDSRTLAKAVTELLSDTPLREQMGREGRKRVLQHYRPEEQLRAMKNVYRQAESRRKQLSPF